MKQKRHINNWWIDLLMLVGYLICFYLEFTGVIIHQWLGVGITLLAILHLWLHLDWVIAVTQKFFKANGARNRWYYLVDLLLLFGFAGIIETGVIISTWLNLDLTTYTVWLDVHIIASTTTLGLLVVKIGIHWKWVVAITRRIFGTSGQSVPRGASLPVKVPVATGQNGMDRRQFLGVMGVVGLGSVLAVTNLVTENTLQRVNVLANVSDETATTVEEIAGSQTVPTITEVSGSTAVESATPDPVAVAEVTQQSTMQGTQETQAVVAACQVRCARGCSFPGHCRRYTDQNGNSLCDLGECL